MDEARCSSVVERASLARCVSINHTPMLQVVLRHGQDSTSTVDVPDDATVTDVAALAFPMDVNLGRRVRMIFMASDARCDRGRCGNARRRGRDGCWATMRSCRG